MEQLRALLDAWIGKYIKQEVAFREGAALPSAAINDLFNMLIAQGDDTTQTLKYACEYLLNFSDTYTARAQFIEQALNAINARMDAVDELANTAANALAELEALKITKLSIDDNSTSSMSAWSSQKVSSQLTSKVNKTDIVQTDTVNDTTKIPSSAVTYALGQEIDTLNDNLGNIKFTASGHSLDASIDITLTAGIYLVTTQRMVGGNDAGMYIVSATGAIFQTTSITTDTAITLSSSGLTLTINNASGVSVAYSVIRLISF